MIFWSAVVLAAVGLLQPFKSAVLVTVLQRKRAFTEIWWMAGLGHELTSANDR